MKPIKTETFVIDGYHDHFTKGKSLVIPLSRDKALRIGLSLHLRIRKTGLNASSVEFWCFIGPRRYQMVVTQRAIQDMSDIFNDDPEETKERFREMGAHIEGELTVAEGE